MSSYNKRIKVYPDGTQQVMFASAAIWSDSQSYKQDIKTQSYKQDSEKPESHKQDSITDADNRLRAIRRARAKMRDYALCTPMTHFVTLTVSPDKADRFDVDAIVKRTTQWANNQVKRHGLRYILVPEYHANGAIHWHGLCDLSGVRLVDSGTISGIYEKPARPANDAQRAQWLDSGGHPVYNIPGWTLGFSTAIPLYGDYRAAVSYCCKYIGKRDSSGSAADKIGGRWYYSGGELNVPQTVYERVPDELVEWADMAGYTITVPGTTLRLSLMTVAAGEEDVNEIGYTELVEIAPDGACNQ